MVGGLSLGCIKCHTFKGIQAEGAEWLPKQIIHGEACLFRQIIRDNPAQNWHDQGGVRRLVKLPNLLLRLCTVRGKPKLVIHANQTPPAE